MKFRILTAAGLLFFSVFSVRAADVAVGLAFDVTSMDPHFANITANTSALFHVFDHLLVADNQAVLQPRLALSWKVIDDTTWEFKLRPGVKFHDGSEFTAEDVVWSLDRPATLVNSPSTFGIYTKSIVGKTIVDKYTVRLKTATPNAMLPDDIAKIAILSKKATTGLSTDDFNAGKGMTGTGPYRFVQFKRGDRIDLVRNETYWGGKPEWDKISMRIITSSPARVAALLAGDVQMIEAVPPADIAGLKKNRDIRVVSTLSSRLIYLTLDERPVTPFITDRAGKPMEKNPLQDLRVRQAISKAINRAALVDKVMEGNAVATGQFIPLGFFGAVPGVKPEPVDIEGAKKLLADAGYPDGFGLTLHGTNDRYVNDSKVLQTIAQMLTRVGIVSKVDSMPASIFFTRRTKLDFTVGMAGWGGGPAHPSTYLKALVTTPNPKTGFGAINYSRYSNPKVDAAVEAAFITFDLPKQEKLWQQATEIAMAEQAIVPLYNQVNVWATRKGFSYVPRTDEATYLYEMHAVK